MAAPLASEAHSIFDVLNLYITGPPKLPDPNKSHRYYLCKEPSGMDPYSCAEIPYSQVQDFYRRRESAPLGERPKEIIVPIERFSPRIMDAAVIGTKLWAPAIIVPSLK